MKNKKKNWTFIIVLFVCTSSILLQGSGLNNSYQESYITHGRTGGSTQKIDAKLLEQINISNSEGKFLVWVEFTDKGPGTDAALNMPALVLTDRAIQRRLKVRDSGNIIDYTDLPVNYSYVEDVKSTGIAVKQISKWFNSISCYVTGAQAESLVQKSYVKRISAVIKMKKDYKVEESILPLQKNVINNTGALDNGGIDYGPSLQQEQVINVPAAHNNGYTGQGVLIASFDTGVDNLGHPCFDSIRARGLRTFDFVNGDTSIANDPGQLGEGSHGTLTLSSVGGYAPGNLVAPAFRSQYIVAKTENTDSETPVEEDNWIAAAEWADSLGADIITSSLGYLDFDPGSPYQYNWTWMNGDSCKITIAADLAVNKGIIVVNSAGNNGFNASRNTLNAPADGDSVLTIGSVDFDLDRSGFSSVGPTVDGRIKPDVMAVGSGNVCAEPGAGKTGYTTFVSGTSISAPMVAGVCAMMLSSNGNLTPMEVVNTLRSTGSNSAAPDRLMGWGIVNAWNAVQEVVGVEVIGGTVPERYELMQNYPNPFNPVTIIPFTLSSAAQVEISVYNMAGKKVATLLNGFYGANKYNLQFNAGGLELASGVYFYNLIIDNKQVSARKMMLLR